MIPTEVATGVVGTVVEAGTTGAEAGVEAGAAAVKTGAEVAGASAEAAEIITGTVGNVEAVNGIAGSQAALEVMAGEPSSVVDAEVLARGGEIAGPSSESRVQKAIEHLNPSTEKQPAENKTPTAEGTDKSVPAEKTDADIRAEDARIALDVRVDQALVSMKTGLSQEELIRQGFSPEEIKRAGELAAKADGHEPEEQTESTETTEKSAEKPIEKTTEQIKTEKQRNEENQKLAVFLGENREFQSIKNYLASQPEGKLLTETELNNKALEAYFSKEATQIEEDEQKLAKYCAQSNFKKKLNEFKEKMPNLSDEEYQHRVLMECLRDETVTKMKKKDNLLVALLKALLAATILQFVDDFKKTFGAGTGFESRN